MGVTKTKACVILADRQEWYWSAGTPIFESVMGSRSFPMAVRGVMEDGRASRSPRDAMPFKAVG